MSQYDVVVVGSGPGGYVAAIRAADLGRSVAIVDYGELGGTCLNIGCIPTKAMLHAAEVRHIASTADKFGLPPAPAPEAGDGFGAATAMWRNKVVSTLVGGVGALLKARGVEVIKGKARLSGEGKVTIEDNTGAEVVIDAGSVILATGSEAVVPGPLGPVSDRVMTSTEALALEDIPASAVIIGGGYIGCEFASYWLDVGCKVTIVEMLPEIVAMLEPELRKELVRSIKRRKGKIKTGTKVAGLEVSESSVRVLIEGGDPIEAERVLISVGRKPRTAGIGLEELAVAMDGMQVTVDDRCRTSLPWLYAIGDITPGPMLAHKASRQGVVAAESASGHEGSPYAGPVPSCVFTRPELAAVGMTETEARGFGHELKIGTFQMRTLGRAQSTGELAGVVKIVADAATEKILGVHIAGERATDLIAEATLAIRLGATLEQLGSTIHAHPTFAEAIMEAAEAARGSGIHSM